MRKLLFLCAAILLWSCSADDESVTETEVNLTVDHYKTTSILYGTALIGAEEGSLEAFTLPGIRGFDFEPGFTYSLLTKKTTTKNPGVNTTTDNYSLVAIQRQDTIAPNTTFSVPMARFINGVGYVNWIAGNAETGYVLNGEIPIDCRQFCGELRTIIDIENEVIGVFEHGPNGTYILKELR